MTPADRQILRDLAKEVADVAALPIQEERRELWRRHNDLQPGRPLILIFPEGSWQELLPDASLRCAGGREVRHWEWMLRSRLYGHEHFADDTVIEKTWDVGRVVRNSGWGLAKKTVASGAARGAWHFDPVIREPADLGKLRFPEISIDEEASRRDLEAAQDLFGDILDVRPRGVSHLSFHLMNVYTGLRGLEEVMADMYAEPAMLHDAMAFLSEGHRRLLDQYVALNLLSLNNDNTYHNSGGNGWTRRLPAPGFRPDRVRLCDLWGSAEAQEMAQVSPEQHEEFVMRYERPLLEPFGLTGYGCCEDLTRKLDYVCALPHIRRISISPFANVDACAARLKGGYIFSWKPHPSHLVGAFDEERIRAYIRHTVEVCRDNGGVLEMILKDTHTCEHRPERFDRWCRIAREEAGRAV
jgi:hypothetical protein